MISHTLRLDISSLPPVNTVESTALDRCPSRSVKRIRVPTVDESISSNTSALNPEKMGVSINQHAWWLQRHRSWSSSSGCARGVVALSTGRIRWESESPGSGATVRWGLHCILVFDMRTCVRMSSGIFSLNRIASVKVKCHRIGQMRTETHSAYLIFVREVEIYSWPKAPTVATIPAR